MRVQVTLAAQNQETATILLQKTSVQTLSVLN